MAQKMRRKKRPKSATRSAKRKAAKKLGYKSGLEQELHEGPLKACEYEPSSSRVLYTTEHYYNPDFVHPDAPHILFEAKGRFREYHEAEKYLAVKRCNPSHEVVFIFPNPNVKAYPQCRKRADGTTLSLGEWATKNGFEWYTPETLNLGRWVK